MAVTDQQILDAVNEAILAIVTGRVASYNSPASGMVQRLSLKELQAMKGEYESRVANAASGAFSVAQFRNPE